MPTETVDLTLSSDSDDEPALKRRRCQPMGARLNIAADDCDVIVVEPVRERPRPRRSLTNADLGDDDLLITATTGQVVTRDLPHPRPDCAEQHFTLAASRSNADFCRQCFCFVCDVKASECRFWGTGARERDHANARPLGYWRRLREAARAGNRSLVHSEYHASGPINAGLPPNPATQMARPLFPFPATGRPSSSEPPATTTVTFVADAVVGLVAVVNAVADPLTADGNRQAGVAANAGVQAPSSGQDEALDRAASNPLPLGAGAAAVLVRAPDVGNLPSAPAPAPAAAAARANVAGDNPELAAALRTVCKLRPMPDPSTDRLAFELGVLQFGVKAARGQTIDALARRLDRFGFYYDVSRTRAEDYGDRLTLGNLFDLSYGNYGGRYKSKAMHLKMLPLLAPADQAIPVPKERVRKVLVIDCQGRTRATYMGVRVKEKCKRADFLMALAPMLRPTFSASSELLHLVYFAHFESDHIKLVEREAILDDDYFAQCCRRDDRAQLVVYRTSHHPSPSWLPTLERPPSRPGAANAAANPRPKWTEMPVYVHSETTGAGPAASDNPGGSSGGRQGSLPAWLLVHVRQYKRPPGEDATVAERISVSSTLFTAPLLVPLRKEHAKGSSHAAKELTTAVLRGLQPYRTTVAQTLSRSSIAVLCHNRSSMADRPSPSSRMCWGPSGALVGTGRPLVEMSVILPHSLPATLYRLEEMRVPAVDPSASQEAMRESEANVAEARRREVSNRLQREVVGSCVGELVALSRRAHPEDKKSIAMMPRQGACMVATDVALRPSSRTGANPREGELVIKVFTWTTNALGRMSPFLPWDDWPSAGKREEARNARFPLTKTMELLVTGVMDPDDQATGATAAAGAGVAAGGGNTAGPSTSLAFTSVSNTNSSLGPAGGGPRAEELQQRVLAERRRARQMVETVKKLCSDQLVDRNRSIEKLLEFMQSGERPAVQQPPGLTVTMRPYQLQSLAFMLEIEQLVDVPTADDAAGAGPSTSSAPAAGQAASSPLVDPADAPDGGCPGGYRRLFWLPVTNAQGQRYWYSPVFERLTREVPPQPTGGFLAEEMGLGKTVEVMALTLANPPAPSVVAGTKLPCGRIVSRATLVVCAVSLVGQWQMEAANKTSGSCRIHPYHGPSRIRDPMRLATGFDVVVTTYQTLQSDHAAGGKDPCQQIRWHRIVFDEGHTLRNAGAKLYKTAVELVADRKWICTGTPINNAVEDLQGQFGAIHLMPLGKKTFFDSYIKVPFHNGHLFVSTPLLYVLRHTMIRHTKVQDLGGQGVLQLPDKTEKDVPVYLTAQEQELYRKVHKEAHRGWQKLRAAGIRYVNSHLFTATSMLMPLRRICSGGLMQPKDLVVPDPERLPAVAGSNHPMETGSGGGADAVAGGAEVPIPEDIADCPICVDTLDQPVVTRCNHWFCRECLIGWINASAHHDCPACRQPVTVGSLRRGCVAATRAQASSSEDEAAGGPAEDGIPCESKLRMLLAELRAMRAADPTAKALVFTQFGQTLDWLKPRLIAEGFGHRTITGDMTQKKRTEAIDSFQRDPKTCVFLLSVRSGAVGINLTAANYVFLLEPCMNPAMEEQAIGRSWRMGQQRPVVVKRFFVKGSVEERVMEVVKMRRSASNGASGSAAAVNPPPPTNGRHGGQGVATAAVAGSLRQDRTDLRINELEMLFRDPGFPPPVLAGGGGASANP